MNTAKQKQKQKREPSKKKQGDEETSLSILYTQTESVAFGLLKGRRWGKHTKAVQLFCSGTTTESKRSIKGFPLSKIGLPQRKAQPVCEYQCMDFRPSLETQEAKDACQ